MTRVTEIGEGGATDIADREDPFDVTRRNLRNILAFVVDFVDRDLEGIYSGDSARTSDETSPIPPFSQGAGSNLLICGAKRIGETDSLTSLFSCSTGALARISCNVEVDFSGALCGRLLVFALFTLGSRRGEGGPRLNFERKVSNVLS